MCSSQVEELVNLCEERKSEDFGRYLVAKCDIRAGDVILEELPMVFAPREEIEEITMTNRISGDRYENEDLREDQEIPICVACCCEMKENPKGVCSKCSLPICDINCDLLEYHETRECEIFKSLSRQEFKSIQVLNKLIMILRVLLLKNDPKNPNFWPSLCQMEHHNDVRAKFGYTYEDNIVFQDFCVLFGPCEAEWPFSPEEIQKVIGVICTNAFNWESEIDKHVITVTMFEKATIFANSCSPNAKWTILGSSSENFRMRIRAAVDLQKGDLITISYSWEDIKFGTLKRRALIEGHGFFLCKCERCKDPTELQSYLSGVKCQVEGCPGYLLPVDPLNPKSPWICDQQPQINHENTSNLQTLNLSRISRLISRGESEIEIIYREMLKEKIEFEKAEEIDIFVSDSISSGSNSSVIDSGSSSSDDSSSADGDLVTEKCAELFSSLERFFDGFEKVLEKYRGKILHPNHWVLQDISRRLFKIYQIFFREIVTLDQIGEPYHLDRFIWHTKNLLKVSNIITPGLTYDRAVLQFYLSKALHEKLDHLHINGVKLDENEVTEMQKCEEKCHSGAMLYFNTFKD